jgi:hypothetical protein
MVEVAPNAPQSRSNNSKQNAAHIIEFKNDSSKFLRIAQRRLFGTIPKGESQKFAL